MYFGHWKNSSNILDIVKITMDILKITMDILKIFWILYKYFGFCKNDGDIIIKIFLIL